MKKLLLFVTLLVLSVTSYAQHKDVTKFLGIPVDGSKSAMIQKLKAKGLTSNPYNNDYLVGQFNGADVHVYVVTNNNKVCRIMVSDANTMDEADIKIRFNTLCQQFQNNNKYISSSDNVISDKEDISYEMSVNSKRYEADFLQMAEAIDSVAMSKEIESILLKKYSKEQVSNLSEEQKKDVIKELELYIVNQSIKKPVWFMINENYGKYYISMFYDNEYNRANGEDL